MSRVAHLRPLRPSLPNLDTLLNPIWNATLLPSYPPAAAGSSMKWPHNLSNNLHPHGASPDDEVRAQAVRVCARG